MSSAESQSERQSWRQTLRSIGKKRGMLELWTGVIGTQAVANHAAAAQKNRDAEDAHVRRTLWGDDSKVERGPDMASTILGDVTNPTPIVVGNQQSSLLPILALAAGALIPGAGIAGYLAAAALSQPAVVEPGQQFQDSSVQLGLGKIEDYLTETQE